MRSCAALLLCPALPRCSRAERWGRGGTCSTWEHTTRSCCQLFPSSQLSAVTAFPLDLGLFVFNICRSFNLVALLFFGKIECVLSIKPTLILSLPVAVVVRAEVSSFCKQAGKITVSDPSSRDGSVSQALHFSCLAVS